MNTKVFYYNIGLGEYLPIFLDLGGFKLMINN